ncbi:uncharacterized protein [Haliotis asinina]|uniref:uncharacterized protein n=1 Tax=Haliotis asinina TaxID=109174 RepID=UPI003531BA74
MYMYVCMYVCICVCVCVCVCVCILGFDASYLPRSLSTGQPPLPPLPNTYEVHIEMASVTESKTIGIEEYFNGTSQQSAVRIKVLGVSRYYYFQHALNELLTVSPAAGTCNVTDLPTSELSRQFGYHGNVSSILQLGRDSTQVFQGYDTVRGIRVRKWTSYQSWPTVNANMNVTWYFSDLNSWDTGCGLPQVPVRAWVQGFSGPFGGNKYFEHIYDMFHFSGFISTKDALQVPDLIYCPNQRGSKTMPSIPSSFSVQIETVLKDTEVITNAQLWLDAQMRLTKRIYYANSHTEKIDDFNAGVSYIMDLERGNCSIVRIDKSDSMSHDGRMWTAAQMFFMDVTDAVYRGTKTVRNMPTDVFVATRTDFPPDLPRNSTMEWYFSTEKESTLKAGTLVQMKIYMPQWLVESVYNIYDLLPFNTDLSTWDVSPCYQNLPRRLFQFAVPGTYSNMTQAHSELFKYSVIMTVVGLTGVSPLRVADFKLEYKNNVLVNFDMLGVPPVPVSANVTQTPLGVAGDMLQRTFSQNQFFVYIPNNPEPTIIKPVPNSFREISVDESTTISTPPTVTTPTTTIEPIPLPSFPLVYEVFIQKVMPELNMSTETYEAFDHTTNQLSFLHKIEGSVTKTIINVTNREVHTINMQEKTCVVSGLGSGDLSDLIGYTGDAQGKGTISSLAGIFVYDKSHSYSYIGSDVVRGIQVRKWSVTNVIIDGDNNNTIDVLWYFSDPYTWDTALNWPNSPVRAIVLLEDVNATSVLFYENVYNFFQFRNFVQPEDAFQTPDLITCPGRTPKKSFPFIALAASFTIETIDNAGGHITYTEESYDMEYEVAKFTHTPAQSMYGSHVGPRVTEVHDFTTGVAYVMDLETGNCTCQLIENRNLADFRKNHNSILIKTPHQLFSIDVKDYSYEGQVVTRDIPTDRFVAIKTDKPIEQQNSTYEWRFATSQYSRVQQSQEIYSDGVPVQIQISMPEYNNSYTFNIYNYIQAKPNLLDWDISSCYTDQKKRVLQFAVPGSYRPQIALNRKTFKRETLNAIVNSIPLSPLRINHIDLKLNVAKNVSVTFTLLDTPPIKGDVKMIFKELSLDSAVAKFAKLVKDNDFLIIATFAGQVGVLHSIPAISTSFRDITEESETTSTSATTSLTQGASSLSPDTSSAAPGTSSAVSSTASPTASVKSSEPTNAAPFGITQTKSRRNTSPSTTPAKPSERTNIPQSGITQTKSGRKTTPSTSERFSTHVPRSAKSHVTTQGLPGPSLASSRCRNNQEGYKTGAVVGVSVAMVIVGGVLGTGVAIFMSRRRNFGVF